MDQKEKKQVKDYILALTNLYGQVPVDIVVSFYNRQNKKPIRRVDVEAYYKEDLSEEFVYSHKDHFVHETTMCFDEFDLMAKKQKDMPYYLPAKEDLLAYTDFDYIEKTEAHHRFFDYCLEHFFPDDPQRAEEFLLEVHFHCTLKLNAQEILDLFSRYGVKPLDKEKVSEAMRLAMELACQVRRWEDRGHTFLERYGLMRGHLTPRTIITYDEDEDPSDPDRQEKREIKLGRNDPCHCGSGKKYKKCCLRADEEAARRLLH